jgi:cobalt-zinc-cadmium efflux system protein
MSDLTPALGMSDLTPALADWVRIDPLLSVFVSMLILKSTIGVLRESYHFLMKGVPDQIDYPQVGADLAALDGVKSVHDLHIWEMSPGEPALTGHLEIADLARWPQVLQSVQDMLSTSTASTT